MEYQEALRFVKDWLWDCQEFDSERSTSGMSWPDEYICDAAKMVRDAVNRNNGSIASGQGIANAESDICFKCPIMAECAEFDLPPPCAQRNAVA